MRRHYLHTAVMLFVFCAITTLNSSTAQAQTVDYFTIQNTGNNEYIRHLNAAVFVPGLEQYKWQLKLVPGTQYYWLVGTDQMTCMHIQNGPVEQSHAQHDWWSAHWLLEPVSGALGVVRIKNRWKNSYLCIDNGVLTCNENPTPNTDRWKFEKVSTEQVAAQPGSQPQNTAPAAPAQDPNADLMQKAGKFLEFVQSAEKAYSESKKENPPPVEEVKPEPPTEEEPAPVETEVPNADFQRRPMPNRPAPTPTPATSSYSFRFIIDCFHQELENEGTGNTLTVTLFAGGKALETQTQIPTCSASEKPTFTFRATSAPVTHVRISTNGTDAFFMDRVVIRKRAEGATGGFELVKAFGEENGNGYCMSTDPQDAFGGWKGRVSACHTNMDFRLDGTFKGF